MAEFTAFPRAAALAALGLTEQASVREVRQAYRRLAKATHPDATGPLDHDAARRFAALTEAYHALSTTTATPPTPQSPPSHPSPGPAPSPAPSPDAAAPPPGRRPLPVRVRWTRPPIVAGPVRITPPTSSATAPGSR